jgi:hypothetical protein
MLISTTQALQMITQAICKSFASSTLNTTIFGAVIPTVHHLHTTFVTLGTQLILKYQFFFPFLPLYTLHHGGMIEERSLIFGTNQMSNTKKAKLIAVIIGTLTVSGIAPIDVAPMANPLPMLAMDPIFNSIAQPAPT